jgi:hypothetical protein
MISRSPPSQLGKNRSAELNQATPTIKATIALKPTQTQRLMGVKL